MTTIKNVEGILDVLRLTVDTEEHQFNDWTVKFKQSHILHSQCSSPDVCKKQPAEKCQYCIYSAELDLPHFPDMVFPNNVLSLSHSSGAHIEFNALDALKTVCHNKLSFKVACAQAWQESRSETSLDDKIKPFDWTFSTDYKGSYSTNFIVAPTEERINLERLKEKEKILFYQDMILYEDELHDNGIASCTVKIRVMPTSFFILLRYFLRVDNIMVRVNDTRIFHEFNTGYVLREYTNREGTMKELRLPLTMYTDANIISSHLPLIEFAYEKLTWNNNTSV